MIALLTLLCCVAGLAVAFDPSHPLYLEKEVKQLQDMVASSELLIRMTQLAPLYRDKIPSPLYSFPSPGQPVTSFMEQLKKTASLLFSSQSGDTFQSEQLDFVFS